MHAEAETKPLAPLATAETPAAQPPQQVLTNSLSAWPVRFSVHYVLIRKPCRTEETYLSFTPRRSDWKVEGHSLQSEKLLAVLSHGLNLSFNYDGVNSLVQGSQYNKGQCPVATHSFLPESLPLFTGLSPSPACYATDRNPTPLYPAQEPDLCDQLPIFDTIREKDQQWLGFFCLFFI